MILRITIIGLLLSVHCFATTLHQNIESEFINTDHGLPADEVKAVYQDSRGYMWFGTLQGLVMYDGYDLKLFSTGNYRGRGLITNKITDIAEDQQQRLWLATDKGVAMFDPLQTTFTFFNSDTIPKFQLNETEVNSIACDHDGYIWIGWGGNGLDVFHPEKGVVKHYDSTVPNSGLLSNWITEVFVDHLNNKWIGSWNGGLTLINEKQNIVKSWTTINHPKLTLTDYFSPNSFFQDSKGEYWMGIWEEGLVRFMLHNNDSLAIKSVFRRDRKTNAISDNIVYSITEDTYKQLWVATDAGMNIIDANKEIPVVSMVNTLHSGEDIESRNITLSVICDHSGIIWAGTMGLGVEKIDPGRKQFQSYVIPETSSIVSQAVHAITRDPYGHLLLGVLSRGFGEYRLSTGEFIPYQKIDEYNFLDIDINTVKCFEWDKQGNLWLGTRYLGLIKLNPVTREYMLINKDNGVKGFQSREIFDITTDRNGFMWIASENGLYKVVPYSDEMKGFSLLRYSHDPTTSHSLSSNKVSAIFHDSSDNLWVSTFDKGINRLISDLNVHFPVAFEHFNYSSDHEKHLDSDEIITIYEDTRKNVWFGTSGNGLLLYDNNRKMFKSIDDGTDAAVQVIYDIAEDDKGFLWLSSNQGLLRASYTDSTLSYNTFTRDNGLQGNNFIKGSSFKDYDGKLFFGGYNGLNIFDPETILPDTYIPPVVISCIKVLNKTVLPFDYHQKPLELKYNSNSFSVSFASLAYSQPENNKYAYQLEGIDPEWRYVDASMRTATYSNLNPGKYRLKYKGSNSMGRWNENPGFLSIIVKPSPYLTKWAIILYVLTFIALIAFILNIVFRSQRLKQALEIEHIERAKSDKLNLFKQQLFTNISHELLTPLTILSSVVDSELQANETSQKSKFLLMQRNIERLLRMIRQFLDYRKADMGHIKLNVGNRSLIHFVDLLCQNFLPLAKSKEISFNYELPDYSADTWFDSEKMDIILHNLISNAFKYTPKGKSIDVKLEINESDEYQTALITIKDTGIGIDKQNLPNIFNRFFSIKSDPSKFSGVGIGLALTKSMVESHKGEISVESELGQGTIFSIEIPVNKEAYSEEELDYTPSGDTLYPHFFETEENDTDVQEKIKQLDHSGKKKQILLVEDNSDFRTILKEQLSHYFIVTEASDGEQALKKVVEKPFDLVISDVLMPKMDGYKLCKHLKSDSNTSHIPIILLTAKVSDEDRASGYEAGADSYITKPFNIKTLLVRIQSLMNQRKHLLEKLSQNEFPDTVEENIHSADEQFLVDVKRVIEDNLSDSTFSVKVLTDKLNVSNSMLYRKVTTLLGISPNELIKQVRLIKATHLLESKQMSVSEVADLCGFSDVSYFGACFKKQYGVSPSSYKQKE